MKSASSTPKISPPRLDMDGPIKITPAALIPSKFLKKREDFNKKRKWNLWKRGVASSHIQDFIQYGLVPFLESFGYSVGMTIRDSVSYCKQWAFAHAEKVSNYQSMNEICFLKSAHSGGQDEMDWFFHTISCEDWFILCENWQTFEFLDNSDVGYAHRADLPFFVWKLINLNSSKAHMMYLDFMETDDELCDDIMYSQSFLTYTNNDDNQGKAFM